jgi:hypothetical protein
LIRPVDNPRDKYYIKKGKIAAASKAGMAMRYGDRDGFGSVYDNNGDLILHQDERVLIIEENVIPSLKTTWRYYGGEYLLEPSKGNVYLTNERMVFINIPERMYAIGGTSETRAMASSDGSSFGIGGLPTGGSQREFFEIPNIEIMASEKREGAVSVGQMVNVYVLSSGNQFHLSMVLANDSDLMNRLMNKRIKALDELVNNLKQYFQQTDWMYNDIEKSMLKKGQNLPDQKAPQKAVEKVQSDGRQPRTVPEVHYSTQSIEVSRTPMRKTPKLGQEQVKYFDNLLSKGLITKDVFEKLVGEYSQERTQERPPSSQPKEQVKAEDAMQKETSENMSDQDLLDILSGAMSGVPALADTPAALEVPEEAPAPATRKAKKVMKVAVKA